MKQAGCQSEAETKLFPATTDEEVGCTVGVQGLSGDNGKEMETTI